MKYEAYAKMFVEHLMEELLKPQTIDKHLDNLYLFQEVYLIEKHLSPVKGIKSIEDFLGHWYMKDGKNISVSAFKSMIATLNKFYKLMVSEGKVDEKAYKEMKAVIKENKQEWLDQIERTPNFKTIILKTVREFEKFERAKANDIMPVTSYKPFYKVLSKIYHLKPWETFDGDDLIAIIMNDQTYYFKILGAYGNEFGIMIFENTNDYLEAHYMINGLHSHQLESTRKQTYFGAYFDDARDLTEDLNTLAFSAKVGFSPQGKIPNVIRFKAGEPSRSFYKVPFNHLLPVLKKAYDFMAHIIKSQGIIETARKKNKLILREFSDKNKPIDTLKDIETFINDHLIMPVIPKAIDEITVKRATKSCKRSKDIWEVDYLYYPEAVETESGEVVYPKGLITVDPKKQEVLEIVGVKSPDDLILFQESTLKLMSDLKIIPKKIKSNNPITLEYFKHLAKSLKIKLELTEDVDELMAAKAFFYTEYDLKY